jgi:uncharacterized sporulation protein YeaH/YhbH (DUF444 family)
MTVVIDRRGQSKHEGISSRRRFLERNKRAVKKAIDRSITEGNITDIGRGGTDVTVPKEDISEPKIFHGNGGKRDMVHPGNKEFIEGDRIPRPQGGGGGGAGPGEASDQGEGQDDFTFTISEEEFLNYMFEDLELPNMIKKGITDSKKTKPKYAGIVNQGPFNKLDLARSKKKKMARMFASEKRYNDQILEILQSQKEILEKYGELPANDNDTKNSKEWKPSAKKIKDLQSEVDALTAQNSHSVSEQDQKAIEELDSQLEEVTGKKRRIPKWNESTDLRFRFHTKQPVPTSKAVMFCLMDVSASMDQETKDNAKRFYFLLYKFLQRHYEQTDIVFIRHHTSAKEVDEEEFFYGKETGGTIVSSALEEMQKIKEERYSADDWNIYGAQASDGDNWGTDNEKCATLIKQLLEDVQGYFYTEITKREPQQMWHTYKEIAAQNSDKFWMGKIESRKDIWPIFREFFKKKENLDSSQNLKASSGYGLS